MLVASGRVALLALGASVTGCIATSTRMISPSLPIPAIAPPNAALVVFVRPSQYKASIATTILEDNGVFMGDSIGGSEFFVTLPPGPHLFLAWAENTAPLRATLLPGRVYYVEVAPHFGFLSPRVQLLAITPRSEKWAELSAWISESQQLVPNLALGQAYLNDRSEDVAKRIRSAHENLSALDPDELAARTLYPEDGVPSPPPLLVPLAPAP
ncbi:MAG TPA: hypothetical protein VNW92_24130, partial [Polyangiaceae bacterium]|nr:hypothetical protein [Polyangiaceae bacterium]